MGVGVALMGVGVALMGVGVALMGLRRPELVMKSIVLVVMAGVLRIYGLIISTGINPKAKPYFLFDGYAHLTSGLACGLAGLAAGMSIGIVGDAGVRMWMAKCYRILVRYDDAGRIIGKAGSSIAAIEAGSSAHIKLTSRGQLLPGTEYLNLHTTLLQQFGLHF